MENAAYFEERKEQLVSATRRLVEVESPSDDVPALNRCADVLTDLIASWLGHAPALFRTGKERRPHLRVDLGERPRVLMIGHFDTVHPIGTLAANPVRFEDGHLHGPGALDMKGGCVSMIAIAARLRELGHHDVTLFFNSDEEIGSGGSASLIAELGALAEIVLVFDFGDGALRDSARGVRHMKVSVTGTGGHAAYPERTDNPLYRLSEVITAARALDDSENGLSVAPTIVTASEKDNVVPDEASVIFDVRGRTHEQFERVESFFAAMDGVDAGVVLALPPFPRTSGNRALAAAHQAAAQLGWPPLTVKEARGASDANTVSAVNASVLDGLGGWGDGAHSAREYLDVDSLVYFTTLVTELSALVLTGETR